MYQADNDIELLTKREGPEATDLCVVSHTAVIWAAT